MSNSYIIIGIQVLAIAIISRAAYRRFLHPLRIYPGPFLASISNAWKFYYYLTGNLHIVEQNLHQKYGPIIRTGPNSLSFSTPEAFESIYGFNHSFEKGAFYDFAREPSSGANNVFTAHTHTEHRTLRRKVVGAALTTSQTRSFSPVITKHVQHFLTQLSTAEANSKQENVLAINIAEPVHSLTFNTLAELIYGPSLSPSHQPWTETPSGENILPFFRAASKFGWGFSHVLFLAWLMSTSPMVKMTRKPTFNAAGLPTGIGPLAARVKVLVLDKQDLVTDVQQPSIAKSMLEMQKEDSRYMAPDQVFRECFNLLFAGPGSTAAAVTGVLERLGREEGRVWQERIRKDLDLVRDFGESKVLNAVVKESLRHSAPFPSAFPRVVRPGAEMAVVGVETPLPVGTLVGANSWVVSHDKGAWGIDAGEWRPDRWLEVQGDAEKKSLDDKFIVFSKGPRGCIGKDIAMMIIIQAVAGIVSKWRIESVGDMKGSSWLEMQIERCDLQLTRI